MSGKNKVHYIRRQPRDRGAGEAGRSVECCVSKNLRQRSQADTDSWHGLFDTQVGPTARVCNLSQKRALILCLGSRMVPTMRRRSGRWRASVPQRGKVSRPRRTHALPVWYASCFSPDRGSGPRRTRWAASPLLGGYGLRGERYASSPLCAL
jgi:hypothetical protein